MRSHRKVSAVLLLVILSNVFFSAVPAKADPIIPPGWEPYTNDACGFTIYIPPGSEIRVSETDDSVRIALPVLEENTNLLGKDLTVECSSNPADKALNAAHIIEVSEGVFNNINFHIEKGEEGAAGSFYQAIKYSTEKDGKYPLISCVLQSGNIYMYGDDVTEFNYALESAVCEDVMGSFGWGAIAVFTPNNYDDIFAAKKEIIAYLENPQPQLTIDGYNSAVPWEFSGFVDANGKRRFGYDEDRVKRTIMALESEYTAYKNGQLAPDEAQTFESRMDAFTNQWC